MLPFGKKSKPIELLKSKVDFAVNDVIREVSEVIYGQQVRMRQILNNLINSPQQSIDFENAIKKIDIPIWSFCVQEIIDELRELSK